MKTVIQQALEAQYESATAKVDAFIDEASKMAKQGAADISRYAAYVEKFVASPLNTRKDMAGIDHFLWAPNAAAAREEREFGSQKSIWRVIKLTGKDYSVEYQAAKNAKWQSYATIADKKEAAEVMITQAMSGQGDVLELGYKEVKVFDEDTLNIVIVDKTITFQNGRFSTPGVESGLNEEWVRNVLEKQHIENLKKVA
jgi:hypothetical protein